MIFYYYAFVKSLNAKVSLIGVTMFLLLAVSFTGFDAYSSSSIVANR
jgi:hypothetical protein